MSDKTSILEELTESAKENNQASYLTMLEEALLEEISNEEIVKAYNLSGVIADFDEYGHTIARGVDSKSPVYSTVEYPVDRVNILSNLTYLARLDDHEGYLSTLKEAKNRLIPDIEIFEAHKEVADEASFNYLGKLK